MQPIELRRAWAELLRLAGAHRWTLLLFALLGAVLPYLLLESEPIFNLRTMIAMAMDPWAVSLGGSATGPLYLLAICLVIVTGSMLAAMNAILADIREGLSSEIMYGLVAGTAYLITTIIFYVVVGFVISLPFFLIYGPGNSAAMPVWLNIARQVLSLVVSSWLSARFCLVGPSMAARGSLEPVSAWFESWRRTAGAQGRLFVLYLVSNIVIGIVVGGFAALHIYVIIDNAATMGTPQETAMSIGWALLLMLLFLFYVLVPTALFRASEPGASGDVFE